MPETAFLTPTKYGDHLTPCLRSAERRGPTYNHRHSNSQVRFSLPNVEDEDPTRDLEEEQLHTPIKQASKIVFPREDDGTLENDKAKHFVDLPHRVMIDVPNDIWEFHSKGRSREMLAGEEPLELKRPSARRSHQRTQSFQSIIADTIHAYKDSNRTVNATHMSPVRLPPDTSKSGTLFLRSDSPLNKYKVAVPLEISVPPYLSPDNRHKRRNSVIYDGDGYSAYLSEDEGDTEGSNGNESCSRDSSGVVEDISDISIPSASHSIVFEAGQDVDTFLGIDKDANVNLKSQVRNLMSPNRIGMSSSSHPGQHTPQAKSRQSSASKTNPDQNDSLKILATPSKTIEIPDLHQMVKSPGMLRSPNHAFFDDLGPELSYEMEDTYGGTRGVLNQSFEFPVIKDSKVAKPGGLTIYPEGNSEDFIKIPTATDSIDFEKRQSHLMNLASQTGNARKRHSHARSRSIRSMQDLDSIEPSRPLEIPERSPLRPSSISSHERSSSATNLSKLFLDGNEAVGSTPAVGRHQSIAKTLPEARSELDSLRHEVEYTQNKSPGHSVTPSVDSAQHFFENDYESRSFSSSSYNELTDDAQGLETGEPTSADDSIQIIKEVHYNSTAPLSTYNSFKIPLDASHFKKHEEPTSMNEKHGNVSLPSRQLSNNFSNSSYETESSQRSHQTSLTSYSAANDNEVVRAPTKASNNNPVVAWNQSYNSPFFTAQNRNTSAYQHLPLIGKPRPAAANLDDCQISREKIGGRFVDVVILDEQETPKKPSHRPRSFHEGARENCFEVMQMCDQTADRAKDVILSLVEKKVAATRSMEKSPNRPLPPSLLFRHR
ncbi:LAMI_0D02784g1_1 [Lachancea mirantina]|uniref:LAMI_0D02784g1_1 n=1 Tax=Lachancea mirantina TaxID=1230905 RepID=A0A1G4J9D1_9SACH|nr:LAMI_0D02784g1_1 [Lachancea mirantina]